MCMLTCVVLCAVYLSPFAKHPEGPWYDMSLPPSTVSASTPKTPNITSITHFFSIPVLELRCTFSSS